MLKVKRTEDTVNRTLRFPTSLLDKMSKIAQNEGVSLNNFVIQCCEYAINDMKTSNSTESSHNDESVTR